MTYPSPRERHRLTGQGQWVECALRHEIDPHDMPDALAAAFSAAAARRLGDPVDLAVAAGEDPVGATRRAQTALAATLGMSRDGFLDAFHGRRWVMLPELAVCMDSSAMKAQLSEEIEHYLSLTGRVLGRDGKPRQVTRMVQGRAHDGKMRSHLEHDALSAQDTVQLTEARIKYEVVDLDRLIQSSLRRGEQLEATVDWGAVRQLIHAPRPVPPARAACRSSSMLRNESTLNVTAIVRSVLHHQRPMRSYEIKREVHQQAVILAGELGLDPQRIPDARIDAALSRLKDRGEVERLSPGFYRATRGGDPEG